MKHNGRPWALNSSTKSAAHSDTWKLLPNITLYIIRDFAAFSYDAFHSKCSACKISAPFVFAKRRFKVGLRPPCRNDAVGSATVSVALAGVPPANPLTISSTPNGAESDTAKVFGGTPETA